MAHETCVHLHNAGPLAQTVHLEPWGEQLLMQPGDKFSVFAAGPQVGELEIEINNDKIFVWAWPTSTLAVLCNGQELTSQATRIAVPDALRGNPQS